MALPFVVGSLTSANVSLLRGDGGFIDLIAAPSGAPPALAPFRLSVSAAGTSDTSVAQGGVDTVVAQAAPTLALFARAPFQGVSVMLSQGGSILVNAG